MKRRILYLCFLLTIFSVDINDSSDKIEKQTYSYNNIITSTSDSSTPITQEDKDYSASTEASNSDELANQNQDSTQSDCNTTDTQSSINNEETNNNENNDVTNNENNDVTGEVQSDEDQYDPSTFSYSEAGDSTFDFFNFDNQFEFDDTTETDEYSKADLLGESKVATSSNTRFTNLAALKNGNPKENTYVTTDCYSKSGDGGGAKYYITSSSSETVDNMFVIPLRNGLKAKLVYDDEVNVAQVGIIANNVVSDKLNSLINKAVALNIKTITFNNGYYNLNKPIRLKSLNYKGSSNTVFHVCKDFATNNDRVVSTFPDETHTSFSLNISNIIFDFPTSKAHAQYDKEMILLGLPEANGCTISNCTFNAYPDSNNGAYMKVTLLWFKHSSKINNIKIENCHFNNSTGKAYTGAKTDHLVGGCLWFCGSANTINSPLTNIEISNCDFYSTISDETLGLWRGRFENVKIDHCNFTNVSQDCDNPVSFYNGSFKNTSVTNCTFNAYSPCKYIIKTTFLTDDSELSFSGNTFNLACGLTGITPRIVSVFLTNEDSNEVKKKSACTVNISGCTFNSKYNTCYRSIITLFNAYNKHYNISNSNIRLPLEYGIFTINGRYSSIKVNECDIDTSTYLLSVEDAQSCDIAVTNSTIRNKLNTLVRSSAKINYEFSGNKCTSPVYGTQFTCVDLSSKDSISFVEKNNTYTTNSKFYEFSSNNTTKASDVIIRYEATP